MDALIHTVLNQFETGRISRRTAIETLAVAAMTIYGAEKFAGSELVAAPSAAVSPDRVHLDAILVNHISYTCPDYRKARDFYADLMGMHVVDDRPDASNPQYGQCNLLFGTGSKTDTPYGAPAGTPLTFMLPRSRNPQGQQGGQRAAATAGAAAQRGTPGRGQQAQQQPESQVTIDHIAYTIADWDTKKVEEILKARGLNPRPDTPNSFHVTDPHGYDLQISGVGMTAYN
jgi:catechol 2,3-dioxygenase-like lactoylglutathione lyase family enzyme